MKKIHFLIINAFIRPFIATFFIVMFVLLMLFLFKYIDDLIGKGFEWTVIMELLWYTSATNVAMALPLAILLSSIMTFGSLGENYELVAIKSAGISLRRAMYPLFVFIFFLSVLTFVFSDYMLPIANLKMGTLLYDVKNKKASFLVDEGVFNASIPGYAIRVDKKDKDEKTLHGISIYQHLGHNTNIILAEHGEMYKTPQNDYLVLKLYDGVRYEESSGDASYNPRQRLIRTYFKNTEQTFDLSSFAFKRENENVFKNHQAMLNSKQLRKVADSLLSDFDTISHQHYEYGKYYYPSFFNTSNKRTPTPNSINELLSKLPKDKVEQVLSYAVSQSLSASQMIKNNTAVYQEKEKNIHRYMVEYYRKFTLPASCLVLFMIGAPMGAIIRKGGLGLPLVVCIGFFLAFHIVSTIAEKWTVEGDLSPIIGMWTAVVLFLPIGLFLTYKASTDSTLFEMEAYKRFFNKFFTKK